MVAMKGHGGGCCGARHLHGFGEAENRNPDLINAAMALIPPQRGTEVILNGTQVRSYPAVLQRLADLGFVLDGHWMNGNHDSHNYRFTRCDNRQPLDLAGWNGMVISSTLRGRLPEVPGVPGGAGGRVDYAPYIRPLPDWQRNEAAARHAYLGQLAAHRAGGNPARPNGQRYTINSPRSRHHGQQFICLGYGNGGYDRNRTLAFRDGLGNRFEIAQANCTLVRGAPPPPPPAGSNMREFAVGDRIQVVNSWGNFPRGLVGTITRVANPQSVTIQFDVPNSAPEGSATNFITIVDHNRQADVPRERIAPPPAARARPVPPPQRHTEDGPVRAAIPAAPVVPAAPPEARAVFSTYHCVFRDGRRGAGYDSHAEAQANLGRRTRVDRRTIMSNGDIVWAANIAAD